MEIHDFPLVQPGRPYQAASDSFRSRPSTSATTRAKNPVKMLNVHVLGNICTMGPMAALRIDVRAVVWNKPDQPVVAAPTPIELLGEPNEGGHMLAECGQSGLSSRSSPMHRIVIFLVIREHEVVAVGLKHFEGAFGDFRVVVL